MEAPEPIIVQYYPNRTPTGIFFKGEEMLWVEYRRPGEIFQTYGVRSKDYTLFVNFKEGHLTFRGDETPHKLCKEIKEQFGFKKYRRDNTCWTVRFTK